MRLPVSVRLKWLVRLSLFLLTIAFWKLGKVERIYSIRNSPDGHFSTFLVMNRGWRSFDPHGQYRFYVEDNRTGESVLAATQPEYCVFEHILLNDIEWQKNSRAFICIWAVQYNGHPRQKFEVRTTPLRVNATSICCGGAISEETR